MQNFPTVSIIIPVFNGANFLRNAINSALKQTYSNIEIIVINDGSTDNGQTEQIARSYGTQIQYYDKKNGGCGSALNLGISKMTGSYFSWLSHDDDYFPDKIKHQIALLAKHKNWDAIAYSGCEFIDENSHYLYTLRPHHLASFGQLQQPLYSLFHGYIHGCSLLIPAKLFKQYGTFNETLLSTQDYDCWFRLFRQQELIYDPKVLIRSRVHPMQSTHTNLGVNTEGNQLWSRLLSEVSPQEIIKMEGSSAQFYKKMAKRLALANYQAASEYAFQRYNACKVLEAPNLPAAQNLENPFIVPMRYRIAYYLTLLHPQTLIFLFKSFVQKTNSTGLKGALRRMHALFFR